MKNVTKVYESISNQEIHLVNYITKLVYSSGNLNGIPQWRDRKRLYELTEKVFDDGCLLTKKDFQFLESLHFKYKV